MVIKRYQAKTEAEATENAKKELGQNVVIMNVRTVKKKGFFSFLRSPMVEVTAALEEEAEHTVERPKTTPSGGLNFNTAVGDAIQAVNEKLQESENMVNKEHKEENNQAIEKRLDNLRSLIEENLIKQDAPKNNEDKEEAEDNEAEPESVVFIKLLYNTMIENEINEKYANGFINNIEKVDNPNLPMDHILSNIYQKMILKFGAPAPITEGENLPKVVFFVGPTGVGKTTTIAKIASKFCVEQHKKITLLTADTYRIAAAEQLRTYASILDVPFRVIYSIEEMQNAVNDFKNSDYILVDTAGHAHNNVQQRETMQGLLTCLEGICDVEVFLVLSATTKYKDLISITDAYKGIVNYKLIFTKLDETTALGNLLNMRLHTGAEMSYVTCGQNVPDDIEIFNPQKTVKQLLSGK